jgi:ribosomal protein S18 acetylase RimI-like enzyme
MEGLELLHHIDGYLDMVPRSVARTEPIGALTLFVNEGAGWRYYARPTPGAGPVSAADVRAARDRQIERGHPQAFEWLAELNPEMVSAAREVGLNTLEHPLMVLRESDLTEIARPAGIEIELVEPTDDLATIMAVAELGFASPGTDVGQVGPSALPLAAAKLDASTVEFTRDRMGDGYTVTAVALVDGVPIASGAHNPLGLVTELVGIATLPSHRRRGIAAALTSFLVEDARDRGVETIFLSADSPEVARIYERAGFEVVGTAGAAEP